MCRKLVRLVLVILVLGVSSTGPARPNWSRTGRWTMPLETLPWIAPGGATTGLSMGRPTGWRTERRATLDFNGSSNYVDIGGNSIVTGTLSLAMWIQPRGIPFTSGYLMPMANDSVKRPGAVHRHVGENTACST